MNRKTILILFFAIVLVLLSVVVYYFGSLNKYDWRERYRYDEKEPYDAWVISELLEDYFPEKDFTVFNKPVRDYFHDNENESNANYIFIGSRLYWHSNDLKAMLNFVERGNAVFISASYVPEFLMNNLSGLDSCGWYGMDNVYDTTIAMNFSHSAMNREKNFSYEYQFMSKPRSYSWRYIDTLTIKDVNFDILGTYDNGEVNFIRVPYKKGYFYIHSTPLVFSNLMLLQEDAIDYASMVFSHLLEGDIYWDRYSSVPSLFSNRSFKGEGPLDYVLSVESLKWSWYLLLIMTLFYVIFRAKRKQRIVRVLETNTNTSAEFIETIGKLYFRENNHQKLAVLKMKHLLLFIRKKYALDTKTNDDALLPLIALKSEYPEKEIRRIFSLYNYIKTTEKIKSEFLISFHTSIYQFYKNCK